MLTNTIVEIYSTPLTTALRRPKYKLLKYKFIASNISPPENLFPCKAKICLPVKVTLRLLSSSSSLNSSAELKTLSPHERSSQRISRGVFSSRSRIRSTWENRVRVFVNPISRCNLHLTTICNLHMTTICNLHMTTICNLHMTTICNLHMTTICFDVEIITNKEYSISGGKLPPNLKILIFPDVEVST